MADQNSTDQSNMDLGNTDQNDTAQNDTAISQASQEQARTPETEAISEPQGTPEPQATVDSLASDEAEAASEAQASGDPARTEPREGRRERVRGRDGGREGGRDGNRETGGYRIRLSDNEQRAAQLIQESFQLRTPVAALGFSIRTVAQLLEQGKLDELQAQHRAQAGARPEPSREASSVRRLEGRNEGRGDGRREGRGEGRGIVRSGERNPSRSDPFARPSRPQPAAPAPIDDTPLVEVAPLLDPSLHQVAGHEPDPAAEGPLPVTIEPSLEPAADTQP